MIAKNKKIIDLSKEGIEDLECISFVHTIENGLNAENGVMLKLEYLLEAHQAFLLENNKNNQFSSTFIDGFYFSTQEILAELTASMEIKNSYINFLENKTKKTKK